MNPGKVVDPYRIDENLRLGPAYNPSKPETYFAFPDDGGDFSHAALRCVGVGKCRRLNGSGEHDVMCPSFMVTREEEHTTRGRARALFEMLQGNVVQDGWRDEGVKEALDLCLACKGCKGDCPVNVDMATYKAEFLAHYWEGRLRPRSAYAFGLIDKWARLASTAPGLVNLFTQLPFFRNAAKFAAGIPQQRAIPAFAPQTFKGWFRKRKRKAAGGQRVILWADTFNNYFFSETAKAAVEVLERAGCDVTVPDGHLCCGRPLYDFGFLSMARQYLTNIMDSLAPEIDQGTPVVVLEPSCCSVFRDELTNLFPKLPRAQKLKENTLTLAEFLKDRASYALPKINAKALVHRHCHHKAIMHFTAEEELVRGMGLKYELLNSGCCGMAGSFGFEKDKYDVSVSIGERVLLPAVRRASEDTMIIADGFSCREQIAQQTNRHAVHVAEVLAFAARQEEMPARRAKSFERVERDTIRARRRNQTASMLKSGLFVAAVGAGIYAGIARERARRKTRENE
jgi:Fe-S oxidoreductase